MDASVFWSAIHGALRDHEPHRLEVGARQQAAVLLALLPYADDPRVVLTVRSHIVEHHKGEISFPGGGADPDDPDLCFTALREAQEEVGIDPAHVRVLGALNPMITSTGFHVTPFVGAIDRAPYRFTPNPNEVAEVLEVPLRHLIDLRNRDTREAEREGRPVRLYTFHWEEHRIWGVTGRMLAGFLDLIQPRLPITP